MYGSVKKSTKPTAMRSTGSRAGLSTSEKAESQEICFVEGRSYADFVEEYAGTQTRKPGEIVTYYCRIHPGMRGAFEVTN